MFTWFNHADDFMAVALSLRHEVETGERYLAGRRSWHGYCVCCRAMVRMRVRTGGHFDGASNLH